jgi:outer membrane protein OmpA-like peptidoglycan-associated protein/uncharacterized protein YidB (DUF937 family)
MGVLDSVVNEVGTQLGISSSSAGSVLSGLLVFIDQQDGGVGAFLDRFRRAGVSNVVTSWLSGEPKTIGPDAVESALGRDTISNIASRSGLSSTAAASAIAMMLPKLIQRLAPGGAIPSRLTPDVASYITGPTAAMASGARQAAYAAETMTRKAGAGLGQYLWPLLALLLVGGLLIYWMGNRRTVSVDTPTAFNVQEQVRLSSERATNALAALRPGYSTQDLVRAMNLGVINFPTASAQIPSESYDFLNKAAAALKNAPAGSTIEVAGHTDNTGNAAANMQLSQQRADAVRDYLVQQGIGVGSLTAKGYGDTRPIASNDSEEGRFRNRRIEFSLR